MINKNGTTIISSADDFGISRLATKNILELVRKGKIDRVEVMMSKNITPEQGRELVVSRVKLDIHLHLIMNKIDYWQDHQRKIDTGAIKRICLFLTDYFFKECIGKQVEREWEKQIKDFQRLFGRSPDGISSHEYIHFFPPYFKTIIKLSQRYGIKYVRLGKETLFKKNSIALVLHWLRKFNKKSYQKSLLETSDYMVSFDWLDDFFWEKNWKKGELEIVFHPEKEKEYHFLKDT